MSKSLSYKVHSAETYYFFKMMLVSLLVYASILSMFFSDPSFIYSFVYYLSWVIGIKTMLGIIFMGYIKGNGIRVNQFQFPKAYEILKKHSEKLDLMHVPKMYIVQGGGTLNAFATRFMKKNYVILYSDVFEAAYSEGIDVVSFIIGHELGHIKRNHVGLLKNLLIFPGSWLPLSYLAYSRGREYTCDAIGYALCPNGALKGLLMLMAGKRLYQKVNVHVLLNNQRHEAGFVVWLAELLSSHPVLIKRLDRIHQMVKESKETEAVNMSEFKYPKAKYRMLR